MDNNKEEEMLWCDRQGDSKGKECKCVCHQTDYSLPKDFPSPQSPVSEELRESIEGKVESILGCVEVDIIELIRKQRQEAYEAGLKERCQNMLSKEETYLKAQCKLAEEIMDYMENGLDEPTDWYVSVKNFLSSRGLLPKITENNI